MLARPFRLALQKQFYQSFQIISAIDLGLAGPTIFTVEIHHVSSFTGTALQKTSQQKASSNILLVSFLP